MAPETLGGERGDERSDLYSLGVVLYEMATGTRPHEAESAIGLMFAILNHAPRPPRERNPALPPALDRLILDLLEREPARRPASAGAVAAALRGDAARDAAAASDASVGTAAAIRSLAVLPLENLSGDASQEFFADGMTEALISDLARLPGLRVISRTSIMRYKGARRAVPEIAAELNVEAVLEGSELRAGARVRVAAQLIDARSDTHLWAERYDRDASDVLALQSDVARAIAHEIHVALSPQASARLAGAARIDPEAHDAYLRGRYQLNRRTDDSLRRAVELFQRAIERAPEYAPAHAGLSETFNVQGYHDFVAPAACFPRARVEALRALELDPALGEAHASLAYERLFHEWDRAGAEQAFRRALDLSPGDALTRVWWVNLLLSRGRLEEAAAECHRARELDPLSLVAAGVLGWTLFFAREYDRAVSEMERALELDADFLMVRVWRGWSHWLAGRAEPAALEFEHAARVATHPPVRLLLEAEAAIARGRPEAARANLLMLERLREQGYVSAVGLAYVNVLLGEHDRALEWIGTAIRDRAPWIVMMETDPRFDPLRGDPRFAALRREAGFE
jgi:TolB-like protein/Tfp pilus assembly protein PilF